MLRSILLVILCSVYCVYSEDPVIQISNGKVQGEIMFTPQNKSFYAFRGIPYAKPPLGQLRFMPPQKPDNWDGILVNDAKDRICIQCSSEMQQNESEDCLYLHVYTPQIPTKEKKVSLPVMYVIHGGGFLVGAATSNFLGPQYLMDYDIVVVSVGYRLGFLGFVSTADLNCPGNNGLKDQQFGLKWVQENIHKFGGNPKQVTLFGQSAGGGSVGYHLLASNSKGFFIGAIQNSGSPVSPWAMQTNPKEIAYRFAKQINSTINENNTSSRELLNFFRTLEVQQIKNTSMEMFDDVFLAGFYNIILGFVFSASIEPEHDGAFLTESPYQKLLTGNFSMVPTILGVNSEECLFLSNDPKFEERMANYHKSTENFVLPNMRISDLEVKKLVGQKISNIYGTSSSLQNNKAVFIKYFSDSAINRAVVKQAELESKYTDVYFYEFAYSGKMGINSLSANVPGIYSDDFHTQKVAGAGRVVHFEEMMYLFDNDQSKNINLFPEKDRRTMKRMLTMWTNFVKYQNPTPKPLEILENTTWPKIYSFDKMPYLVINDTLEVKYISSSYKKIMQEYHKLYDTYALKPLSTY